MPDYILVSAYLDQEYLVDNSDHNPATAGLGDSGEPMKFGTKREAEEAFALRVSSWLAEKGERPSELKAKVFEGKK